MGKHQNLMAYDGFELHDNILDVDAYKKNKLKEVQKNINFISKMFDSKIKVLEAGSGNSKFLYGLSDIGLLKSGVGIEISKSRYEFAERWKDEGRYYNVTNINGNCLNVDLNGYGKFDLYYCSDVAFQFFEPTSENSDEILLKNVYKNLDKGGKIILELSGFEDIISNMVNDKYKTWYEMDEPDPWQYMLWDCTYKNKILTKRKTFIKRNESVIDKSEVQLKIYSHKEIIDILNKCGFYNVEIVNGWNFEAGGEFNEFIVVGEKR